MFFNISQKYTFSKLEERTATLKLLRCVHNGFRGSFGVKLTQAVPANPLRAKTDDEIRIKLANPTFPGGSRCYLYNQRTHAVKWETNDTPSGLRFNPETDEGADEWNLVCLLMGPCKMRGLPKRDCLHKANNKLNLGWQRIPRCVLHLIMIFS